MPVATKAARLALVEMKVTGVSEQITLQMFSRCGFVRAMAHCLTTLGQLWEYYCANFELP